LSVRLTARRANGRASVHVWKEIFEDRAHTTMVIRMVPSGFQVIYASNSRVPKVTTCVTRVGPAFVCVEMRCAQECHGAEVRKDNDVLNVWWGWECCDV
jgi:hypothetical protein